jgi:hypothetical protein
MGGGKPLLAFDAQGERLFCRDDAMVGACGRWQVEVRTAGLQATAAQ